MTGADLAFIALLSAAAVYVVALMLHDAKGE